MSRRDPRTVQVEISRTEARLAELDAERRHMWRHLSALKAELSSVQRAEDPRQPPKTRCTKCGLDPYGRKTERL